MRKEYFPYLGGFLIGVVFTIGFVIGQQMLKRDIWTGIYYSDKEKIEDQRTWVISPPLYSLEECRKWINVVRKSGENYDYQCGQGCRFTTDYGDKTICRTDAR